TMSTTDQQFLPFWDNTLRKTSLLGLTQDRKKFLWLSKMDELVCLDSSMRIVRHTPVNLTTGIVNSVHRLNDGRILACSSGGLFFLNEKSNSFETLEEKIPDAKVLRGNITSLYDSLNNCRYISLWT